MVNHMKAVILCGGLGTRLAEETDIIPKPMVEIGGKPILWHIMKYYSHFGVNDFVIALGYKGEMIKDYFLKYHILNNDFMINTKNGKIIEHREVEDEWCVNLVDTGLETMTGGRIKRLEKWIGDGTFMLTYADGVSNVNLKELLKHHQAHGKLATVTAVRPPPRYGELVFDGDKVIKFSEKPKTSATWINGGYFVLEPGILDFIEGDMISWEIEPLEKISNVGQLIAYRHDGFWQNMDNIRELRYLRELWAADKAAWKVWGQHK
jgi:glucose-1-phosphate cytidylyltransferase